jgi:fibro-slime domain-containing protein
MAVASIPHEVYGGGWKADPSGIERNFYFTSEIAYWFEYTEGMTAALEFTGDDDVWVYVNGHLAVDLGGQHVPIEGRFTLNADGSIDLLHGAHGETGLNQEAANEAANATVADFGLVPGNVYEVKVFQAERLQVGSSYRLTLSGFNAGPSDCVTNCGDAEIGPGEECDDGAGNTGEYNQCTPECRLGPRCGDAIIQDQFGEICDDGTNDGSYGGCAPSCQLGPHCGDAVVQADFEQCDDGINDGGYGECSAGCVLGPYCGDGNISIEFEECDDGANDDGDGCSAACKLEVAVPK